MQHLVEVGCQIVNMDDSELISQILTGNMNAFTFLVKDRKSVV